MWSKPLLNTNIKKNRCLLPPALLHEEYPLSTKEIQTVIKSRNTISNILHDNDDRLVVIVGPCSIHDVKAAKEYANLLFQEAQKHKNELLIVMRVYFEKPRTTIGWKGLINDPHLDNSFNINKGLRMAYKLLLDITKLGLACSTEFLDTITPQYLSGLISWGAIGARTTECQLHRELASGISCPIGFKNGTNGNIDIAVDALRSARSAHTFLGFTESNQINIIESSGNNDVHLILRGGKQGPNYKKEYVDDASNILESHSLPKKVMIDCSHGNSNKNFKNQEKVVKDIASQIIEGNNNILGVMIESNLKEGNQPISSIPLKYGQSITDSCVGWNKTVEMLNNLAESIILKRKK